MARQRRNLSCDIVGYKTCKPPKANEQTRFDDPNMEAVSLGQPGVLKDECGVAKKTSSPTRRPSNSSTGSKRNWSRLRAGSQ